MLRNMATSLFLHERINTTVSKAKALRPFAEKMITLAKKESLHARRMVLRHIKDRSVVRKLFDTLGTRYATRPGGYTRIIRTGFRRGDLAEMAVIELVDSPVASPEPKKKAPKEDKKATKQRTGKRPAAGGTARKQALADVKAAEEVADIAEAEEEAEEKAAEKVEATAKDEAPKKEAATMKPEKEEKAEEADKEE